MNAGSERAATRPDLTWQVGLALRRMRLQRCLSQSKLAELAGISRQALSAHESGQYLPSLLTLAKTLSALGYSWEEFGRYVGPWGNLRS